MNEYNSKRSRHSQQSPHDRSGGRKAEAEAEWRPAQFKNPDQLNRTDNKTRAEDLGQARHDRAVSMHSPMIRRLQDDHRPSLYDASVQQRIKISNLSSDSEPVPSDRSLSQGLSISPKSITFAPRPANRLGQAGSTRQNHAGLQVGDDDCFASARMSSDSNVNMDGANAQLQGVRQPEHTSFSVDLDRAIQEADQQSQLSVVLARSPTSTSMFDTDIQQPCEERKSDQAENIEDISMLLDVLRGPFRANGTRYTVDQDVLQKLGTLVNSRSSSGNTIGEFVSPLANLGPPRTLPAPRQLTAEAITFGFINAGAESVEVDPSVVRSGTDYVVSFSEGLELAARRTKESRNTVVVRPARQRKLKIAVTPDSLSNAGPRLPRSSLKGKRTLKLNIQDPDTDKYANTEHAAWQCDSHLHEPQKIGLHHAATFKTAKNSAAETLDSLLSGTMASFGVSAGLSHAPANLDECLHALLNDDPDLSQFAGAWKQAKPEEADSHPSHPDTLNGGTFFATKRPASKTLRPLAADSRETASLEDVADLDRVSIVRRVLSQNQAAAGSSLTKNQLLKEYQFLKDYYLRNEQKHSDGSESCKLDIGFLFASPLIHKEYNAVGNKQDALPQLEFLQEAKAIKHSVIEAGQHIVFKSMVATQHNFVEMLHKEPKVLHISCHGIDNSATTMGANYHAVKHEGNFLLFENTSGEGELVSAKILSNLVSKTMPNLDLVFVAACKSYFVGKIFQRCGAKHVICVKQKKEVLDEAAISFTKGFYKFLLAREPICEAYNKAKAEVSFLCQEEEADMFQLLLKEDLVAEDARGATKAEVHRCYPHPKRSEGHLMCVSDHIKIKCVPDKMLNLKGREKIMSRIVKSVMGGSRLIMLLGLHGVGKSAVARNAVHYMIERKYFTGGVIFVNLKGAQSFRQLARKLKKIIIKNLDLSYGELSDELENVQPESFNEFLIDFFERKDLDAKLRHKKTCSNVSPHRFLLCLDNAEDLVTHAGEEFRDFLSRVQNCCPLVSTLVTSNRYFKDFYDVPNTQQPEIIWLKQLNAKDAVELFVSHSGEIYDHQIYNLILCDPRYPIKKLVGGVEKMVFPVTQELKSKIMQRLELRRDQVQALAIHDLFKQLSGNPLSILMMAAVHKVRTERGFQNTQSKGGVQQSGGQICILSHIYQIVKEEKGIIDDDVRSNYTGTSSKKVVHPHRNTMSLRISTEASLKLLQETQSTGHALFYLIGCLKDGIKVEHLSDLWGGDIRTSLEILEQLSLLETGITKVQLTPYLIDYSQESIDEVSKLRFYVTIGSYYTKFLESLYQVNSALNPEDHLDRPQGDPEEGLDKQNSFQSSKNSKKGSDDRSTPLFMKNFKELIKSQLLASSERNGTMSKKTIIEQVVVGMGNIEHCLDHFTKHSAANAGLKSTAIRANKRVLVNNEIQEEALLGRQSSDSTASPQIAVSQLHSDQGSAAGDLSGRSPSGAGGRTSKTEQPADTFTRQVQDSFLLDLVQRNADVDSSTSHSKSAGSGSGRAGSPREEEAGVPEEVPGLQKELAEAEKEDEQEAETGPVVLLAPADDEHARLRSESGSSAGASGIRRHGTFEEGPNAQNRQALRHIGACSPPRSLGKRASTESLPSSKGSSPAFERSRSRDEKTPTPANQLLSPQQTFALQRRKYTGGPCEAPGLDVVHEEKFSDIDSGSLSDSSPRFSARTSPHKHAKDDGAGSDRHDSPPAMPAREAREQQRNAPRAPARLSKTLKPGSMSIQDLRVFEDEHCCPSPKSDGPKARPPALPDLHSGGAWGRHETADLAKTVGAGSSSSNPFAKGPLSLGIGERRLSNSSNEIPEDSSEESDAERSPGRLSATSKAKLGLDKIWEGSRSSSDDSLERDESPTELYDPAPGRGRPGPSLLKQGSAEAMAGRLQEAVGAGGGSRYSHRRFSLQPPRVARKQAIALPGLGGHRLTLDKRQSHLSGGHSVPLRQQLSSNLSKQQSHVSKHPSKWTSQSKIDWIEEQLEMQSEATSTRHRRGQPNAPLPRSSFRSAKAVSHLRFKARAMLAPLLDVNTELSPEGRFILYTAANTFLSNDYEHCLKICETDFAYIANSHLFEGNILRFKALAHHEIYKISTARQHPSVYERDVTGDPVKLARMLTEAEEALLNAKEVFKLGIHQSSKGIALVEYHLGCLYKDHAEVFFDSKNIISLDRNLSNVSITTEADQARGQAYERFKHAYAWFKKVNHLKGMHMSKKHMVDLGLKLTQSKLGDSFRAGEAQGQLEIDAIRQQELKQLCERYTNQVGLRESTYIPREQGEDISILSELVLQKLDINCFPQSAAVQDSVLKISSQGSAYSYLDSVKREQSYEASQSLPKRAAYARNRNLIHSEQLPESGFKSHDNISETNQ